MRKFVLLVLLVVFARASFGQEVLAKTVVADGALTDRVIQTLDGYGRLSIFDNVNIQVQHQVVTLSGRVTTPIKRDEIGQRVTQIDGVRSLINDIQVLPLSPFDAQLRQQIAMAIYSYPPFRHYASMALPPIHIVVERGHVTLTGRVANEMDRELAYARAQVPGALSVQNELKLDGE